MSPLQKGVKTPNSFGFPQSPP